jgi:hypothetical protein
MSNACQRVDVLPHVTNNVSPQPYESHQQAVLTARTVGGFTAAHHAALHPSSHEPARMIVDAVLRCGGRSALEELLSAAPPSRTRWSESVVGGGGGGGGGGGASKGMSPVDVAVRVGATPEASRVLLGSIGTTVQTRSFSGDVAAIPTSSTTITPPTEAKLSRGQTRRSNTGAANSHTTTHSAQASTVTSAPEPSTTHGRPVDTTDASDARSDVVSSSLSPATTLPSAATTDRAPAVPSRVASAANDATSIGVPTATIDAIATSLRLGDTATATALAEGFDAAPLSRALLATHPTTAQVSRRGQSHRVASTLAVRRDGVVGISLVSAALRGGPDAVDWWASRAVAGEDTQRVGTAAFERDCTGSGVGAWSSNARGRVGEGAAPCGSDAVVKALLRNERGDRSGPSPLRAWVLCHTDPSGGRGCDTDSPASMRATVERVLAWLCVDNNARGADGADTGAGGRSGGGQGSGDTGHGGGGATRTRVSTARRDPRGLSLHPLAVEHIRRTPHDASILLQAAAGAIGPLAHARLAAIVDALACGNSTCADGVRLTHKGADPAALAVEPLSEGRDRTPACASPAHIAVSVGTAPCSVDGDAAKRMNLLLGVGPPGTTPRAFSLLFFNYVRPSFFSATLLPARL